MSDLDTFIVVQSPGPQGPAGTGAAALKRFDVKDYGAIGDGVTDDRAAFVAALAAANAAGGGEVFVPAGTYKTSSAITVSTYTNITLTGVGWRASKIRPVAGFLVANTNSDQWTIQDLEIYCTTATNTSSGIVVDYPRRWLIQRCYFKGFGTDSIRFDAGLHSRISFCYFLAADDSNTNGHAAMYIAAGGSFATTIVTDHNFVGSAKTYGLLHKNSVGCSSYNDIFEFCGVGLRLDTSGPTTINNPYLESNTIDSQFFDSSPTTLIDGRMGAEPVVTWSAVSFGLRNIIRLSRDSVQFGPSVSLNTEASTATKVKFNVATVEKAFVSYTDSTTTMAVDCDGAITVSPANTLSATFAADGDLDLASTTDITWGGDTDLFRAGAGILRTTTAFHTVGGDMYAHAAAVNLGLTRSGPGSVATVEIGSSSKLYDLGSAGIANTNNLKIVTAGKGLFVKEGSNATMGVATLSGGTVVVSTTAVTASSRIQLTIQSLGTVAAPKAIGVTARTGGTSFTITSADATDTSVVAWILVEPA